MKTRVLVLVLVISGCALPWNVCWGGQEPPYMDECKLCRGQFTDIKDESTPGFFTLSRPLEYNLSLAANDQEPIVCALETLGSSPATLGAPMHGAPIDSAPRKAHCTPCASREASPSDREEYKALLTVLCTGKHLHQELPYHLPPPPRFLMDPWGV